MTWFKFWQNKSRERSRIPVMEQPAITQADVAPALPPNRVVASETLSLRKELAMRLVKLSRQSENLRSELARQTLNHL